MGKTGLGSLLKKRCHGSSLGDIGMRVEARTGKIPFSGRYHRDPRRLQDDYLLCDKVLGSGYSGCVREATSVSKPGQKFAVKSLQLSSFVQNIFQKDKREHLQGEVENYLSMDHPHITRLYDVYESKQELHLVMECMEGGELFDRVIEKKRFSEDEASSALGQMLLALNYIHSHGIVHRDVKLENFIYDSKSSGHLKLIDFGFSKMMDPTGRKKMNGSLGTLSYVAPEVLDSSYTSQCDMWSLGVCAFILVAGYMPFAGNEPEQIRNIKSGRYTARPERWAKVSEEARSFVMSLIEVNPSKRLTAQQALEHPFIRRSRGNHCETPKSQARVQPYCEALRRFCHISKFRRCCLEMLAWSLSNEDRSKVRDCFLSLDSNQQGTITLPELKDVMVDKLRLVDEAEVLKVFRALDYNHDQEVNYSDFLAAMVDEQIVLRDEMLSDAFRRFDTDCSGYITVENLREVLGTKVDGEDVEAFIAEADQNRDGRLSFAEFAAFIRGTEPDCFRCDSDFDNIIILDDEVEAQKMHSIASRQSRGWKIPSPLKALKRTHRGQAAAAAGA